MKKLIHLSIVAIFAITVTSCSKSSNDLAANEKTTSVKDAAPAGTQIANSNYGTVIGGETEIFNFINQPVELELGIPDKSFIPAGAGTGEFAVFYVLVSPDYITEPMKLAVLSVADASTGVIIGNYDLINSENAESYGVTVPDKIKGAPSMFAIVDLEGISEYSNTPLNLYSNIITEIGTLVSRMPNAFTYQK